MNRQVPKYTIIGDGKVARHFSAYFTHGGIKFNSWNRTQAVSLLKKTVAHSDVVLLLISDDAIEGFVTKHRFLLEKSLVHFSGAFYHEHILGCHPLMTFAREIYPLKTYQNIPFICDEGVDFKTLFPQLNNVSYTIKKHDKAYYHALCVIAGNFTQVLMKNCAIQLHEHLDLPKNILFAYLQQNTQNFIHNPQQAVTGPLERGDFSVIIKHMQALKGNTLEDLYLSFVKNANNVPVSNTPLKCENPS